MLRNFRMQSFVASECDDRDMICIRTKSRWQERLSVFGPQKWSVGFLNVPRLRRLPPKTFFDMNIVARACNSWDQEGVFPRPRLWKCLMALVTLDCKKRSWLQEPEPWHIQQITASSLSLGFFLYASKKLHALDFFARVGGLLSLLRLPHVLNGLGNLFRDPANAKSRVAFVSHGLGQPVAVRRMTLAEKKRQRTYRRRRW